MDTCSLSQCWASRCPSHWPTYAQHLHSQSDPRWDGDQSNTGGYKCAVNVCTGAIVAVLSSLASSSYSWWRHQMETNFALLTSSNGNKFRVTGPLRGESTGHRWFPLTKASDEELWCFLWCAPEQPTEQTGEMLVIRGHVTHYDATVMSYHNICHCDYFYLFLLLLSSTSNTYVLVSSMLDVRLNKRLSKQGRCWWFEAMSPIMMPLECPIIIYVIMIISIFFLLLLSSTSNTYVLVSSMLCNWLSLWYPGLTTCFLYVSPYFLHYFCFSNSVLFL